jgi:phage terminase large subunit GpA-like protein
MDACSEPGIWMVVVASSAQVGKSEIILNRIGYVIDQHPGPVLCVQPTLEMAEAFSKDRLAPMLRDSPTLRSKVVDSRSRAKASGNTLRHKQFPGGHLTFTGANSPSSMAMRPISEVLLDEIDRYPESAGSEGDPVELAIKRTATFHGRKVLMTSTPTHTAGRIWRAYLAGDQRVYLVACPGCSARSRLVWADIVWDRGEADGHMPETARWRCPECGNEFGESHRHPMLRDGLWQATAKPQVRGCASFHLSQLYSGWVPWADTVEAFLRSKGDRHTLRVWTNTALGEPFEEEGDAAEAGSVLSRLEDWGGTVPSAVLLVTAAVDVQDDRLEVQADGWGLSERGDGERFTLHHQQLWGDPADDLVWAELDDYLFGKKWATSDGHELTISLTLIDSGGHHTRRVYDYCSKRKSRRIYPIIGRAGSDKPLISSPSTRRAPKGGSQVQLFTVGVDEGKTLVLSQLMREPGSPGYWHLPNAEWCSPEWAEQLTSEMCITEWRQGVARRVWRLKPGRKRNEALDLAVYSTAAFRLYNPSMEKMAERRAAEAADDGENRKRPAQRARSKNWVKGWR